MYRKLTLFPNTALSVLLFSLAFLFSSCASSKKSSYFYGAKDGSIVSNNVIPEPVIQKNDLLSIFVTSPSPNPAATAMFNPQVTAGSYNQQITTGQATNSGYLVNNEGLIQFPVLGNIKTEGLTKTQLENKIASLLVERKQLVDPLVTVRFLNFRVTVLGEVGKPSVVSVPNEKVSLLEALGLAGDLTIYGNRENVMVIREENKQKIIKRINLNSTELLTSPYYYLKSNDIVYVEPNKAKVASTSRSNIWLPVVFGGLSFAAIILDRLIK